MGARVNRFKFNPSVCVCKTKQGKSGFHFIHKELQTVDQTPLCKKPHSTEESVDLTKGTLDVSPTLLEAIDS